MVTPGKYGRSVSIIGVGCTPFFNSNEDPKMKGLSEGELFGYAAIEAMKDAGIDASQIDFFYHGSDHAGFMADYTTPAMQVQEWIGMRGKGCAHHSEGCCTGYYALDVAVNAVASGKYDVVLSGCVEMADSLPDLSKPACYRKELDFTELAKGLDQLWDRAYTRAMAVNGIGFDIEIIKYARDHGLTNEQVNEILNAMAINCRYNAVKNPRALFQTSYDEEADDYGYDSAEEYLSSSMNAFYGEFLRLSHGEQRASGAAALIVCPTDMAWKFTDKPIEVLGFGHSSMEGLNHHLESRASEVAIRQAYDATGVKPEEIDLLYVNDFVISSHLVVAEIAGYLPKGEGWKYVLDGRTRYDGDKPINTNGGRTSFGHAYGASGCADYYEAVKQMRGECGERQVKKLPKTCMLRGFGGGQNVLTAILRTAERKA